MAVKQPTTENEEKLPISRVLDFINESEQRALIIQDYSKIAKQIVDLLGYIDLPKSSDLTQFIKQIGIVDEYLRKISEQVDITKICSNELHTVLKMENPSGVAGIILHRLETVKMPKFYAIFSEELHMKKALNNLFSWLAYTFFIRNLDRWIMKVVSDLQENKKYSILLDVSSMHIQHVAHLMAMVIYQKTAEPIFFNILTSVQHTSIIFDLVKKKIPCLLLRLGKDSVIQQRLIDTTKALIDHFNTFPDHKDYSDLENFITNSYSVSSNYKQQLETKQPWHDTSPTYQYITTNARVGLENLGNTCYMNSILQALALTKDFRQEILFIEIDSNLFDKLQRLLALLLHSNRPALSPDMILKAACPPAFHEGHQQDCSEFLGHLLESLHTQEKSMLNPLSNNMHLTLNQNGTSGITTLSTVLDDSNSPPLSPSESTVAENNLSKTLVQKTFDGSISIVHKCLNCGTISKQNDSFRDLHLSFPDTETTSKCQYSIEDLLDYYCSMERLDADNKYFCDICKMLCDGERLINIVNPPNYLVLTLKYFKYDKKINMRTKLTHNVNHSPKLSVKILSDDGMGEYYAQYRLYAAVVHSGVSMDSGHYYTYGSEQPDGSWYKFNDSFVTECNITALKSLRSPNTPYVLFYEREYDETAGSGTINGNDSQVYPNLDDLPIRLRNYVDLENNRYEKEQRLHQPKLGVVNNFSNNFHSDNDDDQPPPSSCGGNSFTTANQYIF